MGLNASQVDVAILCGGLGTRLRSVTSDQTPKVMVKIEGVPFLEILYQYLVQAGFKRFIFCTGFRGDLVEDYFKHKNPNISFSHEKEALGTAGALKNAESFVQSNSFLVLNGDSFCPMDYRAFLQFHDAKNAFASLTLASNGTRQDGGSVTLDNEDHILSFHEKTPQATAWMNAGIYLFKRAILTQIPAQKNSSLETEIFPQLDCRALFGYRIQEHLYDIGTPERLEVFKKVYTHSPKSLMV